MASRPNVIIDDDETLMAAAAAGSAEALDALHHRYARTIFGLASHSLDRAAAEDVVQDVFLTLWRNAARFDAARGTVRAWILQIAHFRVLNELRRRSRRPEIAPDADGILLATIPATDVQPDEAAWQQHRRSVLQSALDGLPPKQREALGLAFLDDLTHEQVADALDLPLGTAKTRIRTALQNLRKTLMPHAAALGALCLLAIVGVRWWIERATLAQYDRALSMVTASDGINLRLSATPGTAPETHARYRARPGTPIAIVTLSSFAPASAGETYQVWVRQGDAWTSLGAIVPDASGSARLIVEDPAVAALPDEVQVTLEPGEAGTTPRGRVVVASEP